MTVTRCVCFDVTFSTLKKYAHDNKAGLEELRVKFGCGRGCGLCIPYIKEMLVTGKTALPVKPPTKTVSDL